MELFTSHMSIIKRIRLQNTQSIMSSIFFYLFVLFLYSPVSCTFFIHTSLFNPHSHHLLEFLLLFSMVVLFFSFSFISPISDSYYFFLHLLITRFRTPCLSCLTISFLPEPRLMRHYNYICNLQCSTKKVCGVHHIAQDSNQINSAINTAIFTFRCSTPECKGTSQTHHFLLHQYFSPQH